MTAQEFLWAIPRWIGEYWWAGCSVFSFPASIWMYLTMIMNHKLDALLVARVMINSALLCFSLVPLNDGWLPWGVLLFSVGGALTTFLVSTDWCHKTSAQKRAWLGSFFRRRNEA